MKKNPPFFSRLSAADLSFFHMCGNARSLPFFVCGRKSTPFFPFSPFPRPVGVLFCRSAVFFLRESRPPPPGASNFCRSWELAPSFLRPFFFSSLLWLRKSDTSPLPSPFWFPAPDQLLLSPRPLENWLSPFSEVYPGYSFFFFLSIPPSLEGTG